VVLRARSCFGRQFHILKRFYGLVLMRVLMVLKTKRVVLSENVTVLSRLQRLYVTIWMKFGKLLKETSFFEGQFHVFQALLWFGFDVILDGLAGKELIWTTVSRF
jgi:hypothetical protein